MSDSAAGLSKTPRLIDGERYEIRLLVELRRIVIPSSNSALDDLAFIINTLFTDLSQHVWIFHACLCICIQGLFT